MLSMKNKGRGSIVRPGSIGINDIEVYVCNIGQANMEAMILATEDQIVMNISQKPRMDTIIVKIPVGLINTVINLRSHEVIISCMKRGARVEKGGKCLCLHLEMKTRKR